MTRALRWLRHHALGIVLALLVCEGGLTAYGLREIQSERSAVVLHSCQEQNQRHRNTVRELDKVLHDSERQDPARRVQIAASRAPTILLIDQLAPYQNCKQAVNAAVSTKTKQ